MKDQLSTCALAALVAMVGGLILVWGYLLLLDWAFGATKPVRNPQAKRIPGWLLGLIERACFAIVAVFQVPGGIEAMMGWLALKMAANWQRREESNEAIAYAMVALVAGLISTTFAYMTGFAVRLWMDGELVWW